MLLAAFLALNNADLAATGALSSELERHLGLTNLQLGLIVSVSLAVSGVATIPIGMLTDRIRRVPILVASVLLWSGALVATGASTSFTTMLLSRVALGAVAATADAGRLDIMHSRLWGRAEGVRTVFRTWSEAGAPVLFGFVSGLFGSSLAFGARNVGEHAAHANAAGLEYAYLVMLIPLIFSALIAFRTLRTYPRDVATAAASERRTRRRMTSAVSAQPGRG